MMETAEMVLRWNLLMFILLLKTSPVHGCTCPAAIVLSQFPSEVPADACCLNFSGSAFSHVLWSVFTNGTNVQTLDLSNCNISLINVSGNQASSLQRVFLDGNKLTELPENFLVGQPGLTELDLSQNQLQEIPRGFLQDSDRLQRLDLQGNKLRALPENFLVDQPGLTELDLSQNQLQEIPRGFLQDSDCLQRLDLQGNRLRSLPGDLFKIPSLHKLGLDGNQWECSCLFLEGLEAGRRANRTARLEDLVGNLTCFFPQHLADRTVWSLSISNVCRLAGLTALFIVLPLLILSALLLCWCCGRKRKKKETLTFSSSKKRAPNFGCSNHKHHNKQQDPAAEPSTAADCGKEGILKNQLLLRPASGLLGSTRDIYEEVEIKLSSTESPGAGPQEPDRASKTELDTVSVTEVMKDSADREKAYLTQSTEYYSLVPGIELEDSDHGEYENVNLS